MSQGAAQSWDRIKREVQTPRPRRTQLEQLPAEEASGPPLRVTLPAPQGGDQEQRRRSSGPSPPSTLGSCPGATTEGWARMDTCGQSLPTFWGGGASKRVTQSKAQDVAAGTQGCRGPASRLLKSFPPCVPRCTPRATSTVFFSVSWVSAQMVAFSDLWGTHRNWPAYCFGSTRPLFISEAIQEGVIKKVF